MYEERKELPAFVGTDEEEDDVRFCDRAADTGLEDVVIGAEPR